MPGIFGPDKGAAFFPTRAQAQAPEPSSYYSAKPLARSIRSLKELDDPELLNDFQIRRGRKIGHSQSQGISGCLKNFAPAPTNPASMTVLQ
jgi:hypothetical protein